jgi:hypothetical protein
MNPSQDLFIGRKSSHDRCCVVHSALLLCSIEAGLERALDDHHDPMQAKIALVDADHERADALLGSWIEWGKKSQGA